MTGSETCRARASRDDTLSRRERRRELEERLLADPSWRDDRRRMMAILRDPDLGLQTASQLAGELPWRIVAEASVDARVLAGVRHALDRGLALRVLALASGERLTLARVAAAETRGALASEADAALLKALAQNPRISARERACLRARMVSREVEAQARRKGREVAR